MGMIFRREHLDLVLARMKTATRRLRKKMMLALLTEFPGNTDRNFRINK